MRDINFQKAAGFQFDISGDLDMAQQLSGDVRDIERAQKRAVGTLRRRLQVIARRDIQQEYNLKAQAISERLYTSTRYGGLALIGKSAGINLINYGARQNKVGVTYSVKKGTRPTLPHAFIRATRAGSGPYVWLRREGHVRTVVQRTLRVDGSVFSTRTITTSSQYSDKHGYPIFQQYGPSVAQMLKHGDRPERIADAAGQVIEAELDRQLGPK